MFRIETSFIGNYRVGDNISENLKTLRLFYRVKRESNSDGKSALRKPIVVLLGSIAETLLWDLFFRARQFTWEGVRNIPERRLNHIRTHSADKFKKYIALARDTQIFGRPSEQIYRDLENLCNLRNRIHIQNLEPRSQVDSNVFTEQTVTLAEKVVETILRELSTKYDRDTQDWVNGFTLPWNSHLEFDI